MVMSYQPELKIFSGTAHPELAKLIAEYIGIPLGEAQVRAFPDGETSVAGTCSLSSRRARR